MPIMLFSLFYGLFEFVSFVHLLSKQSVHFIGKAQLARILSSTVFNMLSVIQACLLFQDPCVPFTLSLPYDNHTFIQLLFGMTCREFILSHHREDASIAPLGHYLSAALNTSIYILCLLILL